MDDFNYRGKQVEFWKIQGEVLDAERYNETQVHVRSGARYSAPSVRINQTTHHDFWIRDDDGHEQSIQLEDVNIPLRPGQRVTVICARLHSNKRGWICSLVNHTTGQAHEILSTKTLQGRLGLVRFPRISFVLALTLAALVVYSTFPPSGYVADPWRIVHWDWAAAAGLSVLLLSGVIKSYRADRAAKALQAHVDDAVLQTRKSYA